ncbi:hypothetical protein [Halomonas sp.]|uniref:hypothetical protein n=1 Tax=Halomonas sp. TaxID=1486246 RepID=UPI002579B7B9|nr:hypothetical protein [Halomonas sp.]MCJ8286922.1 hypothetical protein [Halomonas sp.]NQY71638.1 hypothetical protein [Halomonas sp.]
MPMTKNVRCRGVSISTSMNIKNFNKSVNLGTKTEIDKAYYLAYFLCKIGGAQDFTVDELCEHLDKLDFSQPNKARLKGKIQKSKVFIKGGREGSFRLHSNSVKKIETEFPNITEKSEEIVFGDSILPLVLFANTRGFIESLAKQVNACYENNLFDACAVMMRRLLEVCLILSYEKLGIESEIKDGNGDYKQLNVIVANAKGNATLSLSRNTKSCLEDFRAVGNFSAHKIYYNAKRQDIKKVSLEYRAAIEELLYKSGLIK